MFEDIPIGQRRGSVSNGCRSGGFGHVTYAHVEANQVSVQHIVQGGISKFHQRSIRNRSSIANGVAIVRLAHGDVRPYGARGNVAMCCIFSVLVFLGPRFGLIFWYLYQPERFDRDLRWLGVAGAGLDLRCRGPRSCGSPSGSAGLAASTGSGSAWACWLTSPRTPAADGATRTRSTRIPASTRRARSAHESNRNGRGTTATAVSCSPETFPPAGASSRNMPSFGPFPARDPVEIMEMVATSLSLDDIRETIPFS